MQQNLSAVTVADTTAQRYGTPTINTEKQYGNVITNSRVRKNAPLQHWAKTI